VVSSGVEALAEQFERVAGGLGWGLAVDVHGDSDLGVPQDLHGDPGVDIQRHQQ